MPAPKVPPAVVITPVEVLYEITEAAESDDVAKRFNDEVETVSVPFELIKPVPRSEVK